MKTTKKFFLLLATIFTMSVLMFGSCITSSAATYPKKIRVYPLSTSTVSVTLDAVGDQIANIKATNKNLKAKLTHTNVSQHNGTMERNECSITLYAKKQGKYTLKFDILDAAGSVKTKASITVFAKNDSPVKKFTFGGKLYDYNNFTGKKSGKVKVVMNKGYKLKKIEVGKYKVNIGEDGSDSEMVYTAIKNNAKVTLSQTPYTYSYTDGAPDDYYYNRYWTKEAVAPTYIRITYIDKYTKLEDTTSYYLSTLLF